AAGMWGLTAGSVEGSCSHSAVHRFGRALYYNADSTPQDAEDYFVHIQDTVGSVDAVNTIGNTSYCCVDGHNGYGRSRYGPVRSDNFQSAANFSNYTRDSIFQSIDAINSRNYAIQLVGSGSTEAEWADGVQIGSLRVDVTGLSGSIAADARVSSIDKIKNL